MIAPDPKGPYFQGERSRLFGVYPAVVTSVQDPDNQGRVQISLPWVDSDDGQQAKAWARLSTMMAGKDRGTWFIPEVDDEVLVSFMAGDPAWPIVIGALWNGKDTPPETMDSDNNVRSITSRSGHKLTFDDTSGSEVVSLTTQGGHEVTLDDASGGTLTIQHSGGAKIEIDSSGKITISTTNQVSVQAPAGVEVTAGKVTVNAGMSQFSGVVKADTVITNTIVAATYTPGAGNVW